MYITEAYYISSLKNCIYAYVCLCMHTHIHVFNSTSREVREKLSEVRSLLLPYGSQGLNLCHWARRREVLLSAEPAYWLPPQNFKLKILKHKGQKNK